MKIKSLFLIPLILMILCNFSFAEDDQIALLAVITPAYTVAGGGGTPTWYYSNATRTNNGTDSLITYMLGSPVIIGADTNITELAFRVYTIGVGAECKIALYDVTTLQTSGACTPVADTWCRTTVTFSGTANHQYRVIAECTNNHVYAHGASAIYDGIYAMGIDYATFPASTQSWLSVGDGFDSAMAICAGGTCSSAPTP